MVWRRSIRPGSQFKACLNCRAQLGSRRRLATPASGTFQYETSEADGIRIASRNFPGATATLGLVAKAGTRYQILPGFAEALEKYAFKNTEKRSALRMTRESELLGAKLFAYHTRENLVIGAKFMREDLPYFVELLGDVATKTRYTAHELIEEVLPSIKLSQKSLLADPRRMAVNSAHGVAFHRGLGEPLHPTSSTPLTKYINPERVAAIAAGAYSKPNIALVANGAAQEDLVKWTRQFFADAQASYPSDLPKPDLAPSKYYGGEERIAHDAGNAMIIAFPGSSSFTAGETYKPAISVLAALLGGQSAVKWSTGFSLLAKVAAAHQGVRVETVHSAYSDAGLLHTTFTGSAKAIRGAAEEVVKIMKRIAAGEISKEDITKAVALAKFDALEAGENIEAGLESTGAGLIQGGSAFQMDEIAKRLSQVDAAQVTKAAAELLKGKATVSSVGDLYALPFAEEIGLLV